MTPNEILQEVTTSSWQPVFHYTDNLDEVVDNILKPHEDYFLKLHSKVKEIIQREIDFATLNEVYEINFHMLCQWQKELFEFKKYIVHKKSCKNIDMYEDGDVDLEQFNYYQDKLDELPNLYIKLGLRTTNVKVGDWTPPHPMFLEDLKSMCFPILRKEELVAREKEFDTQWVLKFPKSEKHESYFTYSSEEKVLRFDSFGYNQAILDSLTEWYKTFETIHFFEDLNGRLGGIVVAILSYLMRQNYLTK